MCKNEPLKIEIVETEEGLAYDVTVAADDATVGDYIRFFDAFLEEKIAPCLGCDLCCSQRIPLTLPDVATYAGDDGTAAFAAFIEKYATITFDGKAVDIKLAQRTDGSCIFLDRERHRCLDHPHRGLVCHSYICMPQTERSRALREALINDGEDALIGELFRRGIVDDAERAAFYPPDPRWQKPFKDIPLKSVLPPAVFAALR